MIVKFEIYFEIWENRKFEKNLEIWKQFGNLGKIWKFGKNLEKFWK